MDLAAAFKALSNPNRLKVFDIIRAGRPKTVKCRNENRPAGIPADAVCVCEITEKMHGVTAPTISHHLKELRAAGLVDVYHCGQWQYYTARADVLREAGAYFNSPGAAKKTRGGAGGRKR